jgi:hypothetical protein
MTTNNTNPEEYNGYPNYQTWAIALWIDNDEGIQEYWNDVATQIRRSHNTRGADEYGNTPDNTARYDLASNLKEEHEEGIPEEVNWGVYADLLNSALGRVDWYYIAQNILDELEPEEDEEEED